jgi:GAF domain/ANTAR domain
MGDVTLTTALIDVDRAADDPATFYRPFLMLLPVSGAAVSTVGDLLGSETVSASDPLAATVDELQFDLGEGPCWDAMMSRRPVLEPHIRRNTTRWPAFSVAIAEHQISSLFAFPLHVGTLQIGAVDLYSVDVMELSPTQTRHASVLADRVGTHVLRRALASAGEAYEDTGSAFSRRIIHQATGVVIAQLHLPPDEARLIIQGQAFATSRSVMTVADDILQGRIVFTHGTDGIEVSG